MKSRFSFGQDIARVRQEAGAATDVCLRRLGAALNDLFYGPSDTFASGLGGDPTALVKLTPTLGTSLKFLRSDSAPALDQTISPTMTGTWNFTPSANATPVTINATASLTNDLQRWVPLSSDKSVVDRDGNIGVNEPVPTAQVSIKAKTDPAVTDADILAMSPYAWWDAGDIDGDGTNNAAYADLAHIDDWKDKSGYGHHLTVQIPGTSFFTLRKTAGPNSKAVLDGRSDLPADVGKFNAWTGSPFSDATYWTAFVVSQNTGSPTWSVAKSFLCSARYDSGAFGSVSSLQFPNVDFGGTNNACYVEGGTRLQTSHIVSRAMGAPTPWSGSYYSQCWHVTAGAHTAYMQGVSLGSGSHDQAGNTGNTKSSWKFLFGKDADDTSSTPTTVTYKRAAVVLLFNTDINETQRQKIETWLSQRFNSSHVVASTRPLQDWKTTAGVRDSIVTVAFDWGIGTGTPASKLHVVGAFTLSTTAGGFYSQLGLGAQAANIIYTLPTTNTTGVLHNAAGTLSWSLVSLSSDTTGTLLIANGGTGQVTALAAFNGLSPLTTRGDLITRDTTNNIRLGLGASGTLLTSNGTDPAWATAATAGLISGTGVALHAPVWLTTTTQGSSDLIVAYGGTFTAELSHLNLAANRVIYLPEVGTDAVLLAYHTVQPTDGLIPRFTSGGAAVEDSLWDASGGTLTSIGSTGIYYQNGSSSVTFKMGSDGLNFWLVTQALSTAAVTYDAHGGGPHQFLQNILLSGKNLQTDTGTGMKIGTATNQRVGFFNATPIVQPANTVPIDTLLASTTGLGLRASGGVARFATTLQPDTNGGISLGANGFGFSSLWLKDTVAAFELQIQTTSTGIAADRVLTIDMGNANRTLDLPNVVYPTSNFTMTGLFGFTHLQDVTFDASKNINMGTSGAILGPAITATAASGATGGAVTITAGDSSAAAGANLTLIPGNATAGSGDGGRVILRVGNTSGGGYGEVQIRHPGGQLATLQIGNISTNRTFTFPDASIIIAGKDIAQTWTATQTFADVKIGTAGNGLFIKEGGGADTMGITTLVAGVKVVNTTRVTANSRIFLTRQTVAGTVGTSVDVTARVAGTSFTITAAGSILDTSTVAWLLVEPA